MHFEQSQTDVWAQNPTKFHISLQTWYVFGPRKSIEALNHGQRETVAQTIDRKLQEMIGGCLQLPPVFSTGFLYVMDATGRRHTLTMDMAHSFEVCLCVKYNMIFTLHLLKISAI